MPSASLSPHARETPAFPGHSRVREYGANASASRRALGAASSHFRKGDAMSTTTASAAPPSTPMHSTSRARPGAARPFSGPASRGGRRPAGKGNNGPRPEAEHEILFQNYFKSVGPRTYA